MACLIFQAETADAQTIRYVGRAVGEITEGSTSDEAYAGGVDDDGEPVDTVFCDESVDCCFDQPGGCEGAAPGGSRTRGGAGESVAATPGFPRVASRVGALSAPLGTAIVSLSGVQAIADSDGDANNDGEQDGGLAVGCGVLTVTTDEITQTIIPELGIEVPVTESAVARCTLTPRSEDGFSSTEVEVFLLEPQPGGARLLRANAVAGVEIPFTTGGAGCAVGPRGGSPLEAAGLVGLLWILARRRRAAS